MTCKMTKKMVRENGYVEANYIIMSDQGEPIGKPCIDKNGKICLLNRYFGTISVERLITELTNNIA